MQPLEIKTIFRTQQASEWMCMSVCTLHTFICQSKANAQNWFIFVWYLTKTPNDEDNAVIATTKICMCIWVVFGRSCEAARGNALLKYFRAFVVVILVVLWWSIVEKKWVNSKNTNKNKQCSRKIKIKCTLAKMVTCSKIVEMFCKIPHLIGLWAAYATGCAYSKFVFEYYIRTVIFEAMGFNKKNRDNDDDDFATGREKEKNRPKKNKCLDLMQHS